MVGMDHAHMLVKSESLVPEIVVGAEEKNQSRGEPYFEDLLITL